MIAWSYLTPGQHAMWLADHDPESDVEYTIAARLLLPSYLTKRTIRDAARFVVDSHPQLRIRISIRSGLPMQSIRVAQKVPIDEIDFSDHSDEEYRSGVRKYLEKPFLKDSGELFRAS